MLDWGPIYVPAVSSTAKSSNILDPKMPVQPGDRSIRTMTTIQPTTILPTASAASLPTPSDSNSPYSPGESTSIAWTGFHQIAQAEETLLAPGGCPDVAGVDSELGNGRTSTRQAVSDNVISGNSPPTLSEQVPSELDDSYFAHWRSTVLDIVPDVFRELTAEMPTFPPLKYALLAVAAANMAHVESSMVLTPRPIWRAKYMPEKQHRQHGLEYYSHAIKSFPRDASVTTARHVQNAFATLLLFHYFELDAGSMTEVLTHMQGLEEMVPAARSALLSDNIGRKLLSSWMSVRSLVVNRRHAMNLPTIKTPSIQRVEMSIFGSQLKPSDFASKHDSITVFMCECVQTTRTMILDWCVCRAESASTSTSKRHPVWTPMLEQVSLPPSRGGYTEAQLKAIDDGYRRTLERQRSILDQWHSELDVFELPSESFVSGHTKPPLSEGVVTYDIERPVQPLKFHTHNMAMNYAYYCVAQLLSSEEAWHRLTGQGSAASVTSTPPPGTRPGSPSPSSPNPLWEGLILRISAGLDPSSCVYKNTFDVGIISILILCAAWSPDLRLASWVDRWLYRVEEHGTAVENAIPLSTMRHALQLIRDTKQHGCDLFLASFVEPEEMDRDEIYKSDGHVLVAMCGKDRATGTLCHQTAFVLR